MLRRSPLKRTPFKSRRIVKDEGPNVEREPHALARVPVVPNYGGGGTTGPAPKAEPMRDRALLDMAHGRLCLLLVPACCNARQDTTVACHENQGKGMGLKQSDERSVWGCIACHRWYDQSGAPRELKRAAFDAALPRQIQAWQSVAADPSEPARFRRAATRALARHGVTA
jgi:hypothetical protein